MGSLAQAASCEDTVHTMKGMRLQTFRKRETVEAMVYVAGLMLQRGSIILFLPVLLSRLTVSEFGTFGLVQSLMHLLPPIIALNLPATVTRLYYDGDSLARRRGTVARLCLLSLACASGGAVILSSLLLMFRSSLVDLFVLEEASAVIVCLLVVWGAVGSAQLQMSYGILRAERKSLHAAFVNVANALFFLTAGYGLALADRLDVVTVVGAYVAAAVTVGAIGSLTAVSWKHLSDGPTIGILVREGVAYGLPMLPYLLGLWALSAGGRWVGRTTLDLQAVGQFTLATQLATAVALVGRSAYEAWAPRGYELFADSKREEARDYLRRQGRRTVAIVIAIGCLVQGLLMVLLPIVAPQYMPVTGIFPIVVIGAICDVAYLRPHHELLGMKVTRPVGAYTACSVAIFVGAAATLSSRFGLYGLAWSFALAFCCQWIFANLASRRVFAGLAEPRVLQGVG